MKKNITLFLLGLCLLTAVVYSFVHMQTFTTIISSFFTFICFYYSKDLFTQSKIKKIIYIIIFFGYIPYLIYSMEKQKIKDIEYDAKELIRIAESQYIKGSMVRCFNINGINPNNFQHENSGNYIGSIYIDDNYNGIIQMSDGNYMIKGNYEDIEIFKSNLSATIDCK